MTPPETDLTNDATPPRVAPRSFYFLPRLDVILVLVLFASALPLRFASTRGDFWLDEADYALAGVRGFQANRWDIPDSPQDPTKMLRLRHYHPPLTPQLMAFAMLHDRSDRTLRIPFVLAGAAAVSLVYLCGIALFAPLLPGRRGEVTPRDRLRSDLAARGIALACALLTLIAPPQIRQSSHALPWALISCELLLLLWTSLRYLETRHVGWLVDAASVLALLFVTSEMFFVALVALLCLFPFWIWQEKKAGRGRLLVMQSALGVVVFLIVVMIFWPRGLLGGAVENLRHYVVMSHTNWQVRVAGKMYANAPKWAYVSWYWDFYKASFLWYALGVVGLMVLALRRSIALPTAVLLSLTFWLLVSAHRAHIIGPEYLAHVLPFLTLCGGLFFVVLARLNLPLGLVATAGGCLVILTHPGRFPLSGMNPRDQVPRWSLASRFLAERWSQYDKMLAPAFGGGARWYLVYAAQSSAKEWQVQALPTADVNVEQLRKSGMDEAGVQKSLSAREVLLKDIAAGSYHYIAVGSTFYDGAEVAVTIKKMIQNWQIVWQSDEEGLGKSRLTIYERPAGVNARNPLPIPGRTPAALPPALQETPADSPAMPETEEPKP